MADYPLAPPPPPSMAKSGDDDRFNSVLARLRLADERMLDLRRQLGFVQQNMLENQKTVLNHIKDITADITSIKHSISEMQDRISAIIKELGLMGRKEDVELLQKYIDLWNPVKFVSIDKLDSYVRDILDEYKREEQKEK